MTRLAADIQRLVATLGSKSNLKKVNRRAILDVDVPKTCQIIIRPEAPMALRLQSNLLYGVSRVFAQQCSYILSDAQVAQSNIRALIRAVKTSELDPNAGKAHPDQLIMHDDPAFLPDFALPGLDIDLSALDISTDDSSRRSSILSPHSQRSSLSSHLDADRSMLGLIIPTSDTGGAGDLGRFILPGENASSAQRSAQLGRLLDDEDEGFNLDPGFTIDADGNLIEERTPAPDAAPAGGVRLGSDSAASGRIRQELLEGLRVGQLERDATDLDLDFPRFDDDDVLLPDAEPFPAMAAPGAGLRKSSSEVPQEQESSESAEAPLQRKPRAPKELQVDARMELHNADLAQWKTDYAENMAEAVEAKKSHKAPALAKNNAAFWVVGVGIGGVGIGLGSSKLKSPLDMFAGDAMMEALTGIKTSTAGQKRGRDEEDHQDSDSEARRVRMRDGDGGETGRGDGMILDDGGTMNFTADEGVEVGRHAPAPLEDPSFPWNVSSALGSRQGSVAGGRGFASSVGGFPTSAGGPSSLPGIGGAGPSSLDRRVSGIPSASPLVGRGRERYSSLELLVGDEDDGFLGGHRLSDDQALTDFQLYGPGAAVDTQTAATSQWVRVALDKEANNFLAFVEAKITAITALAEEEEDELSGMATPKASVSFQELLPPTQNTKLVAAQALHHILALATKSLVNVQQGSPYGRIDISLPAGI